VNFDKRHSDHLRSTHGFESIFTMQTIIITALLFVLATPVLAQQKDPDHSAHHPAAAADVQQAAQ
jgi:hypothetical protein